MSDSLIFIFKAIILGIVEGITEFLPISSTGHLIIVGNFIEFSKPFADLFDVVIQLGAILAVVVLFWNKILESLKTLFTPNGFGFKLWTNLIIAFLPSAIIGFLFHKKVEAKLMFPLPVAGALIVGGIWMIYAENKYRKNNKIKDVAFVSRKQAIIIGCFQCLSIVWPGFSRSASTIIGGWIAGLSTVAAAEFSFFLAIPTMVAATGYSLIKEATSLTSLEVIAIAVGFLVSFIVALLVVEKFMDFLKKHKMRVFAIYRIFVGIIIVGLAIAKLI